MKHLNAVLYVLSGVLSVLLCLAFSGKHQPLVGVWTVTFVLVNVPIWYRSRHVQPRELGWVFNSTLVHLNFCALTGLVVGIMAHNLSPLIPHFNHTVKGACLFASIFVWLAIMLGIYGLYRREKKNHNL